MEQVGSEVSLIDLIRKSRGFIQYLLSMWKLLFVIIIASISITLTLSFVIPVKHSSTLSFVVEDGSSGLGGLSALANSFGVGMLGGGTYNSNNIIQYMQMRTLVEKALLSEIPNSKKPKTFVQEFIEAYKLNSEWSSEPKLKGMSFEVDEDRSHFSYEKDSILFEVYLNLIEKDRLQVKLRNTESSVIDIKVESKSRLFSRYFPERLVEIVSETYITNKTKKSRIQVASITRQVDSVRRELFSSISGAANASDEVFGLNPAMNKRRANVADRQVDVEANTAILKELVKNMELAKMTLSDQTPIIEIVDRPVLPLELVYLKKSKAIVLGFLMGSIIGIGLCVFKFYLKEQRLV